MNRAEGPKPVDAKPMPRAGASARADQGREEEPQRGSDGASTSDEPAPPASASRSDESPLMPPMATSAEAQPEMEPEDDAAVHPMPMPESSRGDAARVAAGPVVTAPRPARPPRRPMRDVVRSAEQFRSALRRLGDRGGTIRVGAARAGTANGRGLPRRRPAGTDRGRSRRREAPAPLPPGARPGVFGRRLDRPAEPPLGLAPSARAGPDRPRSGGRHPAERLAAIAVGPGTELILDD